MNDRTICVLFTIVFVLLAVIIIHVANIDCCQENMVGNNKPKLSVESILSGIDGSPKIHKKRIPSTCSEDQIDKCRRKNFSCYPTLKGFSCRK